MSTPAMESKPSIRSGEPGNKSEEAICKLPKPVLIITNSDLPSEVRGIAAAIERGDRVLGGAHSTDIQALFDSIPGAIARRLQRITPESFTLAEISIELALDVSIPGFEMGGTVTATLRPKD